MEYLSKREQQIMEVLYRLETASATDIMGQLEDPLSNSSVRTFLRILENKGLIGHEESDGKFLYHPIRSQESAAKSALDKVVDTFFKGSVTQTVAALITENDAKMSPQDIEELERLIAKAKSEGR